MSEKKKYKKALESLEKRIAEHRQKQQIIKKQELFHYWEKEIQTAFLKKRLAKKSF